MAELSKRELTFCYEYIANNFNGEKAAKSAGYKTKQCRQQASKMLTKSNIKEKVEELTKKHLMKLNVSAEKVLNELAIMAFVDTKDVYEFDGKEARVKSFEEMGKATRAIQEIQVTPGAKGKPDKVKIKLYDKKGSLELLGKYHKLFTDKIEHSGDINVHQNEESDSAYKKRFKD